MGDLDLEVIDLARELLMMVVIISGPILIVGLMVGISVSLFQALTSIQEQTMSLVPKMFAVMAVLLFLLAPTLQLLADFTTRMLDRLVEFGLR